MLHLKQPLIDLFERQFLSRFKKPSSVANLGHCYPGTGTTAIVNYLFEQCEASGIQFILNADLHKIQKEDDSYTLFIYMADKELTTIFLLPVLSRKF